MTNEGPLGYVFAVAEKTYCCWEHDHTERSLSYLQGLDCSHYRVVAEMLAEHLDGDLDMPASMLLRSTYHQAVEALMSLLGALAQAPLSAHSWIAKCGTPELQDVVRRLDQGRELLTPLGRQRMTFQDLADHVFQCVWANEDGEDATARRFARFWQRLAAEYLDDRARAEYNAIKHGNRVSPGGFYMSIGVEEERGVAAPASAMRSLGGSKFGSTFLVPEPVGTKNWHFRARRVSINWSAEALLGRLVLISMSIADVVAAMQCNLGVDPSTVQFLRPEDGEAFEEVWKTEPGMRTSDLDVVIRIAEEDESPREELRTTLEARRAPVPEPEGASRPPPTDAGRAPQAT